MKTKNIGLMICMVLFSLISIIIVSAVTINDVSSSPEEVIPGEIVSVSIDIENILEDDVQNLDVKLDLSEVPFAPYQSSSEEFLEELESDDEETFTFKLIVFPEAESRIYKIPVKITYDYEEELKEKNELISLTVNSEPELKVALEDSVILIKGKESEINLKIINSGLSDVKFVYVDASEISGVKITTSKEQYLGDIDSDDFDYVKYNIYLESDVADTIKLPVVLKYKDATNKEYTETKIISLRTYSLKEAQKLGLVPAQNYFVYLGIGGIAIFYVIYRFRKKRKLKKKKEN